MEKTYQDTFLDFSFSKGRKHNQQFALAIFLEYDQS